MEKYNEMNNLYFVTYKMLGPNNVVFPESYMVCVDRLTKAYKGKPSGRILDSDLEKDPHGKLHLHCIWQCYRKHPLIKQYLIPGYNLDMREVTNIFELQKYIHKNNKDYDEELVYSKIEDAISAWKQRHPCYEDEERPSF